MDKRLLEGFGEAANNIVAEAKRSSQGKEILLQYQRALSQECEETQRYLERYVMFFKYTMPYLL